MLFPSQPSVQGPQGPAGPSAYAGTSVSTNTIGTGVELTFVTQAGLSWGVGLRARIAAGVGVFVEGPVTSYSGTTLRLIPDLASGSGSYSAWVIAPASERGAKGDGVDTITPEYSINSRTAAAGGNVSGDLSTRAFHWYNRERKALVANRIITTARQRMATTIVATGHSAVSGSGALTIGGVSLFRTYRNSTSGSICYWLEEYLGPKWHAIARGISGQWPDNVACRQGGVPILITATGNSIPAAGSSVALTSITPAGGPYQYQQSFGREIWGSVLGVDCHMWTPGDGVSNPVGSATPTYNIERVSGASPLALPTRVSDGAALPVRFSLIDDESDFALNVFWPLRNNDLTVATARRIAAAMFNKQRQRAGNDARAVMLGAWPFASETTGTANNTAVLALNADLADRYGPQFFDVNAFWRRQYPYDNTIYPSAFTVMGLTETANDTTDINNGIVPRTFLDPANDPGHPNNMGYKAAAKGLIEIHFALLGYVKIIGNEVYQ